MLRHDEEGVVLRAEGEIFLLRPERRRQERVLLNMTDGVASPLWSAFATPLRAFIARRAPPGIDADDVLQDVFLRIHKHLPDLRDSERIGAWIFQLTRNALADAQRGRHKARTTAQRVVAEPADADDQAEDVRAAEAELVPCLEPMIARLEEPYRSAIRLTGLEGCTNAEAAKRTGVSISAMKSRSQRGRAQLKQMLLDCCSVEIDRRGRLIDDGSGEGCQGCGLDGEVCPSPSVSVKS
jgi:RNA polymerase sigma-70 factor (ECF subfamily)